MSEYSWYEVWADDTANPPNILTLLYDERSGFFDVYDHCEKRVRFRAKNYEESMFWLTEDEYTKVDGRMQFE